MITLKEFLKDWTDMDLAAYHLGSIIGITGGEDFIKYKWLYWTNNSIATAVYDMLQSLTTIGFLVFDDEAQKYKWNKDFALTA